ncbi:hypothetical protein GCM10011309_00320 [Litorimonas cladophorae]|uniref:DUF306 domain-containing protein n=1 Tax=Litorimonas cladophorae TaxID=1220491 RepID=A0A918N975_9PROT|nr:META domain-containing protein [Litorimonas cladophorae]GGX55643.1 hypothetical protein GCM10011309_00320 [Litorimonas cladophorae]
MAFPIIIPLAIGALVLAGCAKVATDVRNARPLANLEGSEWSPVPEGPAEQFVAFKQNGEIIGHGGCNAFFGQYSQDGTTLTLGALASTKKMCYGSMESEANFMRNLQDTRRVEATHLKLSLFDADGEALMHLRRRDWD